MTSHHLPSLPTTPFAGPTRLAGIGNTAQQINPSSGPRLAHITGNLSPVCPQPLIVFGYGEEFTHILVNAIGPYQGTILLSEQVSCLAVHTENDWSIELLPVATARVLQPLSLLRGKGDEVIRLATTKPTTAFIQGNEVGQRFCLIGHHGRQPQLLVNTTEPYHQRLIFNYTIELIEIRAVGPWRILLV